VKELQYKIFCIADGHGQNGHMVSTFIKFHLPSISNYILENIKSNIGE
jgi:serine/threonine protein phosphatase PrpC